MKNYFAQAIADGLNEIGYGVDVPNEKGEMLVGPESHEVQTINEKLNKLIESWPERYAFAGAKFHDGSWLTMDKFPNKNPTYKARIAFIEEMVKKTCKHEPMLKTFDFSCWQHGVCRHCGVELQATWSEKK